MIGLYMKALLLVFSLVGVLGTILHENEHCGTCILEIYHVDINKICVKCFAVHIKHKI